ncbi:MAG: hypothetical protein PUA84_06935 [Oscillospiraceae bacterium]|nr:hypothetical protein [Oscillospiraceae bacterium]
MKAKRIVAALMCLNLCLTAAACGNKEDNSSKEGSSSAVETTVSEAEESTEETSETEGNTDVIENDTDYNVVKTFWKSNIPDTLKENEEDASEGGDYSTNVFEALDRNEEVERSVKIEVTKEDSMDYRRGIISYDIDLKDYADGKVDTVTLGGMDFVKIEREYWGETSIVFMARYEASQMSVTIKVTGDADSEDIQSVLNTIEFTLPEGTETDAPYPWDGEPLITEAGTVQIGSYNLTAKQIIASESILPNDIFDNRVAVVDDTMYALSDYHLYILKVNGTEAELQETVELEDDYGQMSCDENCNVYVSGFMGSLLVYRDGKQADAPEGEDQFVISRDGSFGVEYFTSPDKVNKVTINSDGTASREILPVDTSIISMVSDVFITKDYILISGSSADDNRHRLFMFDHNGNYLKTLADEENDSLGSITGAVQTDNGILAVDGNMRTVILWDNDGKYIGEVNDGDLFGTNYPWISGLMQTKDGNIYVSMVEERTDKSWDEMIMFQLDSDF